jgi:hypothetical protein
MFSEMSMNAKGDHAIGTLKRSGVLRTWSTKSKIHVDFVEMSYGTLVFL